VASCSAAALILEVIIMKSHGILPPDWRLPQSLSTPCFGLLLTSALAIGGTFAVPLLPALAQTVELVKVDIAVVSKGHQASKLIGSKVVNDKNEKIGTIDDIIIDEKKSIFTVLQVGGFLGLGGYLVAIPYDSLSIDASGKTIKLAGGSQEALKALPEFKYKS
jgi:sporulation protein YlmC with PRC-barrel domain